MKNRMLYNEDGSIAIPFSKVSFFAVDQPRGKKFTIEAYFVPGHSDEERSFTISKHETEEEAKSALKAIREAESRNDLALAVSILKNARRAMRLTEAEDSPVKELRLEGFDAAIDVLSKVSSGS